MMLRFWTIILTVCWTLNGAAQEPACPALTEAVAEAAEKLPAAQPSEAGVLIEAKKVVDCSRLPAATLRDDLFRCAQLGDYVRDLDALDRDILFMRSRLLDLAEIKQRATEEAEPRNYSDFIPDDSLQALLSTVKQYCAS